MSRVKKKVVSLLRWMGYYVGNESGNTNIRSCMVSLVCMISYTGVSFWNLYAVPEPMIKMYFVNAIIMLQTIAKNFVELGRISKVIPIEKNEDGECSIPAAYLENGNALKLYPCKIGIEIGVIILMTLVILYSIWTEGGVYQNVQFFVLLSILITLLENIIFVLEGLFSARLAAVVKFSVNR